MRGETVPTRGLTPTIPTNPVPISAKTKNMFTLPLRSLLVTTAGRVGKVLLRTVVEASCASVLLDQRARFPDGAPVPGADAKAFREPFPALSAPAFGMA